MKQNTFSILFLIRKTRLTKKGEAPIQMRITANGRFIELNTQRKIEPANWNQKKERVIGKTPAYQEINRYLELLRTQAYEIQKKYFKRMDIRNRYLLKNIFKVNITHAKCFLKHLKNTMNKWHSLLVKSIT